MHSDEREPQPCALSCSQGRDKHTAAMCRTIGCYVVWLWRQQHAEKAALARAGVVSGDDARRLEEAMERNNLRAGIRSGSTGEEQSNGR